MIFEPTPLDGAYLIVLEEHSDERGSFARTYCETEFSRHGLEPCARQCNLSYNRRRGTLRGLHMQAEPHPEAKLVRCSRGRLFDVIVDARAVSKTQGRWYGVELSEGDGRQLYVPPGFLHGFLTLDDHTDVTYQMSADYVPALQVGCRYDDPTLAIEWPTDVVVVSDRDAGLPSFRDALGSSSNR